MLGILDFLFPPPQPNDPGKLGMVGYTAGAQSRPEFDWARNLIGPAQPADVIAIEDRKASSVFAFAWNVCQQRAPRAIVEEYENFLLQHDMPRMDGNRAMATSSSPGRGEYEIDLPGMPGIKFSGVKLAPPCGAFAVNYSK